MENSVSPEPTMRPWKMIFDPDWTALLFDRELYLMIPLEMNEQ